MAHSRFSGLVVSAEVKAAIRELLAEAILHSRRDAEANEEAWRARARAAEADAEALRQGVVSALNLELREAPFSCREALAAVEAACGPPLSDSMPGAAVTDTPIYGGPSFLRQCAIVQAVREFSGSSASASASPDAVASFLYALLVECDTSSTSGELPRHAAAFADASVRLLCAAPEGAFLKLARKLAAALVSPLASLDGARPCLSLALVRFASLTPPAPGAAGALLLACAESVRDACVLCTDSAERTAARPLSPVELPDEAEAEGVSRVAPLLVPAIDAALCALANSSAADRQEALNALSAFARCHAHSQRLATSNEPLRLQFGLLTSVVRHTTAAANSVALHMLKKPAT